MSRLLFAIFLFLLSSFPLLAIDEKKEEIRQLLISSGSEKMGVLVVGQMISRFKQLMPQIPEEFWEDFRKELKSEDMVELIIPIYDKYFTLEEIKGITAFYNSPVGKKLLEKNPQITQESMQVGEMWGKKIAERVLERLKAKGLLSPDAKPQTRQDI
ncbi:PF09832 family protein [Leptospira inadai serovar Lyme str. 10]|uniref:PF09832 family protein n=2 Tax=Leptospira inadai serovar Lyme TaxID=293084 RepID=V6HUE4_9LEPT|nr:DUF2059 domain-containing protein [Leptospira inadai]EQA36384.1 PF09832 family protein [Leptospira inadai serovar Lyme str. 10]PNV74475.1 DUF2059 domain-containing protein [Leptospira inadai serovar Lyme]